MCITHTEKQKFDVFKVNLVSLSYQCHPYEVHLQSQYVTLKSMHVIMVYKPAN